MARERVGRLREGALEVRGEARRVGVRGIEKGRRVWPARTPAAACSGSARLRAPHGQGKRNGEAKSDLAIATAVESLSGAGSRRLCTPSPWQKTRGTIPSLSVFYQILTVQNSEFHIGTRISVKIEVSYLHAVAVAKTRGTVPSLSVFYQILTVQNSKFHIGTRISVKIEVVEDKMIYNFVFGHNLI